ncbi:FtsX-like permease family protein [Gorillibacterium sp. CAU 1737]|uniref:FtsX-like permease family protein n=1 Tax=Gorillibacterium sp. CAU 1737 TaxID=3140362 RepID=UPI00326099CF
METFILLRAGIRHKKGAFWSIVVLMFIITFSITAIISVNGNIKSNLEHAMAEADVGDVVAFVWATPGNADMVSKIRENAQVDRLREEEALTATSITINGKNSTNHTLLQRYVPGTFQYPVFNESRNGFEKSPSPLAKGEIFVPLSYASLYNCKVGSSLVVKTNAGENVFRIKGFIQEPFVGAYFIGIKSLFITEDDYSELKARVDSETEAVQLLLDYRLLHIFQADSSELTVPQFKKQLHAETGFLDYSFATLLKEDSIRYSQIFTKIGAGILTAFVILLFLIVIIIIGHSISTGIEMDSVNIGVLKSQGFTKGKLRQVLTLQYLSAQLIGAVMGNLAAIPLIKWLGRIFQPITGMLATADVAVVKSWGMSLAILLLGSLFVFGKTARVGAITPLRAIAGDREPIYFDSRLNLAVTKRGLDALIAFRQFTSDKKQYAALLIIVGILVYFMISMTLLTQSMTPQSVRESYGNFQSDVALTLNNRFTLDQTAALEEEIGKLSPVKSSLYTANFYLTVDGSEYHTTLYNDPTKIKSVTKGRAPLYDNEIVVTEVLAGELGKALGDTVTISYRSGKADYLISGYYESMNDVGRSLAMSLAGGERIYPMKAQEGHIQLAKPDEKEAVISMLNDRFGTVLTSKDAEDGMDVDLISTALDGVTMFIFAVSVVFAFVVVFMVCNRTFLKERPNIGIYKAMGFTSVRLRLQFALRFLLISAMGSVIGILASGMLSNRMISTLLRSLGITNFKASYTLFSLFFPAMLIGLCFFVFAYLASAKIKHVTPKELIVE